MNKAKSECIGCGRDRIVFRRGYCQSCYAKVEDKSCRAKVSGSFRVDPFTPTDATPGSPEKIRILAARFAAGVDLHHPDDVRFERTGPGRTIADTIHEDNSAHDVRWRIW